MPPASKLRNLYADCMQLPSTCSSLLEGLIPAFLKGDHNNRCNIAYANRDFLKVIAAVPTAYSKFDKITPGLVATAQIMVRIAFSGFSQAQVRTSASFYC